MTTTEPQTSPPPIDETDLRPFVATAHQLLVDAVTPTVGREASELTPDEVLAMRTAVLSAVALLADLLYSDADPDARPVDLPGLLLQLAARTAAAKARPADDHVGTEIAQAIGNLAAIDLAAGWTSGHATYSRLHGTTLLLHTVLRLHRHTAVAFTDLMHPEEQAGPVRRHRARVVELSTVLEQHAERACIEIDRAAR